MRSSKLRIARWYALPLSIILTGLHISCCVIPLFSVAILSFFGFSNLIEYKPFLTVFQFAFLGYFGVKLVGQRLKFLQFHSESERLSYRIGFILLAAGCAIGYLEPFKTENQKLAEQHFERFKNHRSVELVLSGTYDRERLLVDIDQINGVRKSKLTGDSINISFVSGQTTSKQIIETLERHGYEILRK